MRRCFEFAGSTFQTRYFPERSKAVVISVRNLFDYSPGSRQRGSGGPLSSVSSRGLALLRDLCSHRARELPKTTAARIFMYATADNISST